MCPERPRGFAIISAIFILVVLAALGGFIATVATTQHVGSALDVIGARSFQAARSGTEWGLYQALKGTPPCSPAGTNTAIGSLDGISVTVNCITVVAPGSTIETGIGAIYSITATACNLPAGANCPGDAANPNYVERRITALVEKP